MADINLNLDDIKPLLSSLGLGQAPPPPPKMDALPPPPMQMPPTPAAAGFSEWAGDPQNQKKVSDGITSPGTPLTQPFTPTLGVGMPPSPNAPNIMPPQRDTSFMMPPTGLPTQAQVDPRIAPAATLTPPALLPASGSTPANLPPAPTSVQPSQPTMAQDIAANPSQYQQPGLVGQGWKGFLKYGIPAALVSAGSGLSNMGRGDPTAGAKMLGEQIAQDRGVPAANAAEYDLRNVKPLRDAAQLADIQSQTAQRNSAANKADTAADDMKPFTLTREQATAINHPELAGTQATMRDYNKALVGAGNNNTSTSNNAATNATKVTTTGMNTDSKESIAGQKTAAQKTISDAANKTKLLMQNMRDSTSRANNENTVSSKGTTGAGGFKVPADVTKRAALGSNVLENADAVEGIINKRPDIIGMAGGRYSNVQQMIGSDDPDIQALGVRMHNIALASNGAHGVRSQQAIQKTEDELYSNFKAGPNAIKGALGATRSSMQTFLNDEQNFSSTGKRTGGVTAPPTGGGNSVTAPDGSVHAFPNAAAAEKFKQLAGIK